MTESSRPNPDEILASLEREEKRAVAGSLKIFFGMAAGVGKTYAMLKEAAQRRGAGTGVLIGLIEAHGRRETDELTVGFETLPLKEYEYRGVRLRELDADGVLARKPALVLVDELAHTNAPGSRNAKRWQDVIDFLDSGIDVYSTMNIQHLESYADAVEDVIGVPVGERVPDSVFDRADEIVLIDLPPDELLRRLDEGKVYFPGNVEDAKRNFFKVETLAVLRELALNVTERLVDRQLAGYLRKRSGGAAFRPSRNLLVAVSASPNSEYLIR
jgi:two-component system, OmpR family, sensor histidine kinase KdpD